VSYVDTFLERVVCVFVFPIVLSWFFLVFSFLGFVFYFGLFVVLDFFLLCWWFPLIFFCSYCSFLVSVVVVIFSFLLFF